MKCRSLRLVELDAAEKRVDAMIQAVPALRAPLDTFYNSLTEEQKRRLDSLANRGGHNKAGETIAQLCSDWRLVSRTCHPNKSSRLFNQKSSRCPHSKH